MSIADKVTEIEIDKVTEIKKIVALVCDVVPQLVAIVKEVKLLFKTV